MYAENSDKTLVSTIPTTDDSTGYVWEWEVSMQYDFPAVGYTTSSDSYTTTVTTTVGVSTYNLGPTDFNSTLLIQLSENRLDQIFDYEYMVDHDLSHSSRTTHTGFAVTSLSIL